jgi:hypothetical protein
MQRAEMEELRHREANNTALQAIGPRKKLKLDSESGSTTVSSKKHIKVLDFLTIFFFRPRHLATSAHPLAPK